MIAMLFDIIQSRVNIKINILNILNINILMPKFFEYCSIKRLGVNKMQAINDID